MPIREGMSRTGFQIGFEMLGLCEGLEGKVHFEVPRPELPRVDTFALVMGVEARFKI